MNFIRAKFNFRLYRDSKTETNSLILGLTLVFCIEKISSVILIIYWKPIF